MAEPTEPNPIVFFDITLGGTYYLCTHPCVLLGSPLPRATFRPLQVVGLGLVYLHSPP